MKKIDGKTSDLIAENIEKLKQLFPEIWEEGKVDLEMLKKILGEKVETERERYSFSWHGKSDAIKMALKQSTGTLRPKKADSKNWDKTNNLYIEGDNLEVLRVLQDSYRGKVKMIYIDPPYNTGKDFVYEDNFSDNIKNYKEKVGDTMKANTDTSGRKHTNWLNMMYPRLRLARNLLKDDGVIFISIDDNEQANLKKVCDEIFGEENFVANIIWHKKYAASNDAKFLSEVHDYVLLYAKNKEYWKPNLFSRPKELNDKYSNPDNDPRGDWYSTNLSVKTYTPKNDYIITSPSGMEFSPPPSRCWVISKERYGELLDDNRIWFGVDGKSRPYLKTFLSEVKQGIVPTTYWGYKDAGHNVGAKSEIRDIFYDTTGLFDTPKPTKLIRRMIQLSEDKDIDNIFMDFFSGSATTAHAVMQLNAEDGGNRKFIMVQLPEATPEDSEARKAGYQNICEIGKERIRRAGEKIVKELREKQEKKQEKLIEGDNKLVNPEDLDIGFKVFELDETNFTKWDPNTQDVEKSMMDQLTPIKADRADEDAVYEIMLKYGVDLTMPIEELKLAGKKVFSLAGNYLLLCLEKQIGLETVGEMAKLSPHRVVFFDDGFADDTVKANAEQTLKKAGVEEILVI